MLLSKEIQFLPRGFPFQSIPQFFMCNLANLLLDISIELFFSPFQFPSFCIFFYLLYVANAITVCRNWPSFVYFNVVFSSLYWYIYAILNVTDSAPFFFSWHRQSMGGHAIKQRTQNQGHSVYVISHMKVLVHRKWFLFSNLVCFLALLLAIPDKSLPQIVLQALLDLFSCY